MLREDNADVRLTYQGRAFGLIKDAQWLSFEKKKEDIANLTNVASKEVVQPESDLGVKLGLKEAKRLIDLMKRPDFNLKDAALSFDYRTQVHVQTNQKYAGYIEKHSDLIEKEKT